MSESADRKSRDATFVAFILDQLGGDVRARAMFGGHGLYRGEVFFAIISAGRFYLRTEPVHRAEFERRGMAPFRPGNSAAMIRYWEVPPEVLDDAIQLRGWAERAIASERTPSFRG